MPATQFANAHELRAFLRLCIDPGPGRDKRTPVRLVGALSDPITAALDQFAPAYLRAYRETTDALTSNADRMTHAYATAVLAWIRDEEPGDDLHDLVTAAAQHGRECRRCSSGGTLAAGCGEGARIAAALLAPAETAPEDEPPATAPEQPADDEGKRTNPPALPWLDVLEDGELGNVLGELALALAHGRTPLAGEEREDRHRRALGLVDQVLAAWRDRTQHRRPTSYLTPDGRVWTYRGEHRAKGGAVLYESPTSPKAYSVAELRDMYGWAAAIEGTTPAEGDTGPVTLEAYARVCRTQHLVPFTTALVRGGVSPEVHAAVHVSLDPDLELSTEAVDQIETAICDGLAYRED